MSHQAVVDIPEEKIDDPDPIRDDIDESKLDKLVTSILANGPIHPPRVLAKGDGRYEVLVGSRRIKAQRKAGARTIACTVHDKPLSEAEKLKIQLAENAERVDLNPMEEARTVYRYMEASGLNATDTAKELNNISITDVSRCRERVEDWCVELQKSVASGQICPATGHQIHRIEDPDKKREMIRMASEGRLTRDSAAGLVKHEKAGTKRPEGRKLSRVRAVLDGGCSVTVCAPALALDSFIELLEHLICRARKVRPQGLGLDTFIRMLKDSADVE
jgi:ParB family chromosome partitioning protein